jgi:hypothetical protein
MGNVIAHTVVDVDDLKKTKQPKQRGSRTELYDRTAEKGPSIPTYVFLPSLIFAPKLDEAPQCGESEAHHKNYFSPADRRTQYWRRENVNFNDPSLRWRVTPSRKKREGKKKHISPLRNGKKECPMHVHA